jgi:succinate dehydrogenase/fumarate reductase cytochrome b subunit
MRQTASWAWFIMAGVVILLLAGLHMTVMHLNGFFAIFNPAGGSPVTWENVVHRSQSLFFVLTYILLLGAVLYHGFYGLRTIIFELGIKKQTERYLTVFLWVVGTVLFAIGTYAAIAAKALGIAA